HDQLRRVIRAGMQCLEVGGAKGRDRIASTQNGVAVGMLAPERFVVQLEYEVIRRILHHPDLLEHDFPLEIEIAFSEERLEHKVADDISGDVEMLIEHARLIHRVLTRRVRVERTTKRFELEGNLLG